MVFGSVVCAFLSSEDETFPLIYMIVEDKVSHCLNQIPVLK